MTDQNVDAAAEASTVWQGLVLPAEHPLRRRLPRLSRWRSDDPAAQVGYDDDTLFYGALFQADRGRLRLYGPRLFNLRPLIGQARFSTAGRALPAPRIRHFKRYVTLDFPLSRHDGALRVEGPGVDALLPIMDAQPEVFAGRNVLYTMSQDNDPAWICDWVSYHHRAHGADAVVIADNGSTRYDPASLVPLLAALKGVQAVRLLSVPYSYGPGPDVMRRDSAARFLQAATANFARDAWLGRARAVLSGDVDELVVSERGESVFDRALASRLGLVTFPGYWRFAAAADAPIRHRDHLMIHRDRIKPCSSKYAFVPQGPLRDWSLMVHGFESIPRAWVSGAPDLWYAHCFDISTRWKHERHSAEWDAAALQPDAQLTAALQRGGLL